MSRKIIITLEVTPIGVGRLLGYYASLDWRPHHKTEEDRENWSSQHFTSGRIIAVKEELEDK